VRGAQGGEVLRGGAGQVGLGGGAGVGDRAAGERFDVGGRRDEQQHLVGAAHAHGVAHGLERAAARDDLEPRGVADAGAAFAAVVELTGEQQTVRGADRSVGERRPYSRSDGGALGPRKAGVEGEAARGAGGEPEDEGLGRGADESLARERYAGLFVGDPAHGLGEVERAAVTGHGRGGGGIREGEVQVAERLVAAVGHVGPGAEAGPGAGAGKIGVHERLGLVVFPREEQAADLGQGPVRVGAVGRLRRAGPHAVLVQHDAFPGDAAVERGAEPAVAERGGLEEVLAGGGQQDLTRLVARGGGDGEGGEQDRGCEKF
jgi:hypothetical protein